MMANDSMNNQHQIGGDLSLPENLCASVRTSCEQYFRDRGCPTLIEIDDQGIAALAERIHQHQNAIVWDAEDWHYRNASSPERTGMYILALDAINFCFWPSDCQYEYVDLAKTLTNIMASDDVNDALLSPQSLKDMTPAAMQELFMTHHAQNWYPPDIEKRCTLWNEVGSVLLEYFNGSCMQLIRQSENSAVALVRLLVHYFPGFRDMYISEQTEGSIFFLKRAQICVGDWNAALDLHLDDMDQLTTFADYRVPQLLRYCNVLVYGDDLADLVDSQSELLEHSEMELAIRTATVVAVERLVVALHDEQWNATTTDWYLWQLGEKLQQEGVLKPHHRVRTIFY